MLISKSTLTLPSRLLLSPPINSLGKAALFPFPLPLTGLIGLLLLATASNAALVKSLSLPLSSSSYGGLKSGTEAAILGLFLGVLEGPGESPLLTDLVRVVFKAFPGDVGNDVRRGRRGLEGGIVLVMRRAEADAATEDGGVID